MSMKESIRYEFNSDKILDEILEELGQIQKQTEDGEYYLMHNKGFNGKPIDEIAISEWKKYKERVDLLNARLQFFKMGSNMEINKKIDSCWKIIIDCKEFLFGIELKGYRLEESNNLDYEYRN